MISFRFFSCRPVSSSTLSDFFVLDSRVHSASLTDEEEYGLASISYSCAQDDRTNRMFLRPRLISISKCAPAKISFRPAYVRASYWRL